MSQKKDKQPPNDEDPSATGTRTDLSHREIEYKLLAVILAAGDIGNRARMTEAREKWELTADDFYPDDHQKMFAAMIALDDRGSCCSPDTVNDEMQRRHQLADIGSSTTYGMAVDAPNAASIDEYAEPVKYWSGERRKAELDEKIMQAAASGDIEKVKRLVVERERIGNGGGGTFTLDDLMGEQIPALRWVVPDLLPEGLAILAAKPKIGKSWMVFGLAIAVASDGKFLNHDVIQGEVLYLALEDGKRRLKSRAQKLLGDQKTPQGLHLEIQWPRLDAGGISRLDRWLKQHPAARLVIVDVFQKVRPPRSRNGDIYAEDSAAMGSLQELAKAHHVAILVVHHTRKASAEDVYDEISGSTGIAGPCDVVMVLQRTRGEREATLHITGREIENETSYAVRFDADTCAWQLLGDAEDVQRSASRKAILECLKEHKEGLKPIQIAEFTDLSRTNIRKLLYMMRREEHPPIANDPDTGKYCLVNIGNSGNSGNRGQSEGQQPGVQAASPDEGPVTGPVTDDEDGNRAGNRLWDDAGLLSACDGAGPVTPVTAVTDSGKGEAPDVLEMPASDVVSDSPMMLCAWCHKPARAQAHTFADGPHSECHDARMVPAMAPGGDAA